MSRQHDPLTRLLQHFCKDIDSAYYYRDRRRQTLSNIQRNIKILEATIAMVCILSKKMIISESIEADMEPHRNTAGALRMGPCGGTNVQTGMSAYSGHAAFWLIHNGWEKSQHVSFNKILTKQDFIYHKLTLCPNASY